MIPLFLLMLILLIVRMSLVKFIEIGKLPNLFPQSVFCTLLFVTVLVLLILILLPEQQRVANNYKQSVASAFT